MRREKMRTHSGNDKGIDTKPTSWKELLNQESGNQQQNRREL